MTACPQPVLSAGEPYEACRVENSFAHAFGPFAPFGGASGTRWRSIGHWDWGGRNDPERLWSLRFDVLSQIREGGPHSPVEEPLDLAAAPSHGLLRVRIDATRWQGRGCTSFFVDAAGVDVYAEHVHAELWAPVGVGSAGQGEASQGASLGVLDTVYLPSVTKIGSSLRPVGTLQTYASAGEAHPVPPRATRYTVLSGSSPNLRMGTSTVHFAAAPSGPTAGATAIELASDSVIAWEVAP